MFSYAWLDRVLMAAGLTGGTFVAGCGYAAATGGATLGDAARFAVGGAGRGGGLILRADVGPFPAAFSSRTEAYWPMAILSASDNCFLTCIFRLSL